MKVSRAVVAVALMLLGCWCLFCLALFAVLVLLGGTSTNPFTDYLKLAAWVPASWFGAYLVQPWWPRRWRRRGGSAI